MDGATKEAIEMDLVRESAETESEETGLVLQRKSVFGLREGRRRDAEATAMVSSEEDNLLDNVFRSEREEGFRGNWV